MSKKNQTQRAAALKAWKTIRARAKVRKAAATKAWKTRRANAQ